MLTYALFPQIGLKFLENRNNPDAFEPAPGNEPQEAPAPAAKTNTSAQGNSNYDVKVDGKVYQVEVAASGTLTSVKPSSDNAQNPSASAESPSGDAQHIDAPLSGNVFKILVQTGDAVEEGDVVMILEAMKMETEIRSAFTGTVSEVLAKEGEAVASGQPLIALG